MFTFVRSAEPIEVYHALGDDAPAHLLDVRSRVEYAESHAAGALSMPIDELDPGRLAALLGTDAGHTRPLYLICETGVRAEQAIHKLRRLGLHNTTMISGGTRAWRADGLPLARGSRLPSLERQVQIAVGVVLLVVLAKAMLLHPVFYALIAVLAVGLIVAGERARHSLSSLLSRMPWNRHRLAGTAFAG